MTVPNRFPITKTEGGGIIGFFIGAAIAVSIPITMILVGIFVDKKIAVGIGVCFVLGCIVFRKLIVRKNPLLAYIEFEWKRQWDVIDRAHRRI